MRCLDELIGYRSYRSLAGIRFTVVRQAIHDAPYDRQPTRRLRGELRSLWFDPKRLQHRNQGLYLRGHCARLDVAHRLTGNPGGLSQFLLSHTYAKSNVLDSSCEFGSLSRRESLKIIF